MWRRLPFIGARVTSNRNTLAFTGLGIEVLGVPVVSTINPGRDRYRIRIVGVRTMPASNVKE